MASGGNFSWRGTCYINTWLDKKKIMPVSAYLEGEYGVKGLFIGVPAVLGANGMEKIIEMDLTPDEKEALTKSVASVQKTTNEVIKLTK